MTGDRSLRDYDLEGGDDAVIDDPLVFLAQPDSLIVTKEFADRNHIAVGESPAARHHGRRAAVHGPRHHEAGGSGERVRRQPRDHGHLRRAEDVRARPHVRSHRPRGEADGTTLDGRAEQELERAARAGLPGRSRRRARPAVRSDARRLLADGRTSPACSRCSSGCSSSTTRSRSP